MRIPVQELKKHGVVQLKAKFELKAPQSTAWLPNYAETGRFLTTPFADDDQSYHYIFALPPGT